MRKLLALFMLLLLLAVEVSAAEQEPGWYDESQAGDYAFTMAFVGDTQTLARHYPEQLTCIYDWLLQNAQRLKLQLVAGLGDITDTSSGEEWFAATDALFRLNGHVPYTLARGNHDDADAFDAYLSHSRYSAQLNHSYDGLLNSYVTFSVGSIDYLVLTLDFGPSHKALTWGNNVIRAFPDHNVIVVTHGYMDADGVLLTPATSQYAPTALGGHCDGPDIWEGLVKKHPNICMVVCGHISHPVIAAHQATGEQGNPVWQVLADPQETDLLDGPGGYVALFHFSADGRQVTVENYATVPGRYWGSPLHFTVSSTGGTALVEEAATPTTAPARAVQSPRLDQTAGTDLTGWIIALCAAIGVLCVLLVLVVVKKPKQEG